jgi:hypothetical protein
MSDLHHPKREPQIDTVGWLFLAFGVAITAVVAIEAYRANTIIVNIPVSHVVAR